MSPKYWLLFGSFALGATQLFACTSRFSSCESRRNCPPGGGSGVSEAGAGGEAGVDESTSAGKGGANPHGGAGPNGSGGDGGDGNSGGAADGGAAGDGGESPGTVCAPNQPACDGNRATTCNANGSGYLADGLKCSSKQTCQAGACEDQECSPNASFCSGNSLRKCADNGLSSAEVLLCSSNQYCDIASAACKAGVCAANQPACDGTRATRCSANGDGYLAGGTVCKANETCDTGLCKAQVCTPNQSFCQGQDVKICSANGLSSSIAKTCTNQTCVAAGGAAECKGVCAPGQQDCSSNGVRTCDASGQYGAVSKCTNKTCVASGTTASCVGSCEPAQTQCSGNSLQSCGANGAWSAAMACAAATPICTSNTCQAPPSCSGLAASCGTPNESCCTSPLVTGGSFKRDNDANYPATVSTFRLDKFEVTVGRFRKFVSAVVGGWAPAAGAGKHAHLNGGAGLKNSAGAGYETGWDAQWSVDHLPTNKATWDGPNALGCGNGTFHTWTSENGGNETRPINCVSWFRAAAFCIWDGGFLPSEAEWSYAAVGGSAQREYPWGSTAPGMNANLAVYDCYLNGSGICSGITSIAPVGSVPLGNGAFGQADLVGNVSEWTADWWAENTATCDNCASLDRLNSVPVLRGGDFFSSVGVLGASDRATYWAEANQEPFGVRCARIP
ncbi:MAG TPA: SUMF1/EgtB/PvdO family nonheme iron enzyme [Polyangiaceae bacterium]|nr:SUMF1/EgtB/PvdO family nonheme iron enzyme [Polyangiaceae bacterium]